MYTRVAWATQEEEDESNDSDESERSETLISESQRDTTAFLFNNSADAAKISKFAVRYGHEDVAVHHAQFAGPCFGPRGLFFRCDLELLCDVGIHNSYCSSEHYDMPDNYDLSGAGYKIDSDSDEEADYGFAADEIEVFAVGE